MQINQGRPKATKKGRETQNPQRKCWNDKRPQNEVMCVGKRLVLKEPNGLDDRVLSGQFRPSSHLVSTPITYHAI
jgi:hypothetical protein